MRQAFQALAPFNSATAGSGSLVLVGVVGPEQALQCVVGPHDGPPVGARPRPGHHLVCGACRRGRARCAPAQQRRVSSSRHCAGTLHRAVAAAAAAAPAATATVGAGSAVGLGQGRHRQARAGRQRSGSTALCFEIALGRLQAGFDDSPASSTKCGARHDSGIAILTQLGDNKQNNRKLPPRQPQLERHVAAAAAAAAAAATPATPAEGAVLRPLPCSAPLARPGGGRVVDITGNRVMGGSNTCVNRACTARTWALTGQCRPLPRRRLPLPPHSG